MSMAIGGGVEILSPGRYWQDLRPGQTFKTLRRKVTETDLVGFIGVTGMLEVLFTDPDHPGAITGRLAPGSLTHALIEGLQFQTLLQGVGLALLSMSIEAKAPVRVGDTIFGIITITDVRPTSRENRAVVRSDVTVLNQRNSPVMTYTATRLLAGRPVALADRPGEL